MKPVIIVPCFNEANRVQLDAFEALLAAGARILFVDDGSTDDTGSLLDAWVAGRDDARVLRLPQNRGKAEAVRAGLLRAVEDAEVVGYFDADLATPVHEIIRLLVVQAESGAQVVLGARVGLLGRRIERDRTRHWLGRLFATTASMVLGISVYDTQCGAKIFAVTPTLNASIARPFAARWAFDVELIGRLLCPASDVLPVPREAFVEVPLRQWSDVSGSQLTRRAMVTAGLDLMRIGGDLRRRRRSRIV